MGGCLSLHWRQWQAIGANQWVVSVLRDGYRIPFRHQLPPPPPSLRPGTVPNVPFRLSKSSRPASRGRDNVVEGSLGESLRSGSRLLQPSLPGGKGVRRLETRDRPLSIQRVCTKNSFQDGNCHLSPPLSEERRLPGLCRPEGRVLPDTRPRLLQEMAPFCFERDGPSIQGPVLRIIDCLAGLHQSLRDSVGLGPRPWSSSSPVPGRLAGPGLYRGQIQTAHPGPSIPVQLPRGSTQQREVRPQPVTVGGVSRHDHRHSGCPNLPYTDSYRQVHRHSEEIPSASGTPRPALAGVVGTYVIAGEAGSPRKTQNALTQMASEVALVPREGPSQPPGTPVPAGRGRPLLVDGEGPPTRGDALRNPNPDLRLYSDASREGWGAHLLDQSVSGVWSHQESSLHINLLELKALFLALRAFSHLVTDHRVTAMCDNSTVVAYVNKQGGTVSDSLCSLTGQLLRWTESNRVQLEARYLPGQSNVLADLLSRRNQVLGAEWSLHPKIARDLLRKWGSPTLDLFAIHLNAKLPLYCSLIPDPQALFEDSFRHHWDNLDTYAFPPFQLVERVVARVRETPNLSMTLVAPLWPEKAWFAELLLLLTQPPLALPLWDRLLRQPHFHQFHGGVHALNLHAWRLSSVSSESQAFREELCSNCPAIPESPLHAYTSRNGSLSVVGVVEEALLQSTPLYP